MTVQDVESGYQGGRCRWAGERSRWDRIGSRGSYNGKSLRFLLHSPLYSPCVSDLAAKALCALGWAKEAASGTRTLHGWGH